MAKGGDLDQALTNLFDAERRVRQLHGEIADSDENALLAAASKAIEKAVKEPNEDEASMRLERLAALLGELEGPRAVDLLIDILATDFPDARAAAGEQLEGLAYDRFKEVAKGVERALKRLPARSPALPELPYLLAEVPEPGVLKLLELFLAHEDADAVAAAIEVAVEIGDPQMGKHIEKLRGDSRTVEMTDENEDSVEVTIGDLVDDALDIFSDDDGDGDDEGDGPAPPPAKKK
ncbi:MAG: hypothetical protein HOW73_33100 [Polyangiaceae bacterium]|nr:hypothetical protein [Polyangiaceae bacterium]